MTAFIVIFILFFVMALLIYGSYASHQWRMKNHGKYSMNEYEHYYFRFFYFNPGDKRFFLYQRAGGGYTLNFASPIAIILALVFTGCMLFLLFVL